MPSLGGFEWVIMAVVVLLVATCLIVVPLAVAVRLIRKPKVTEKPVPERLAEIDALERDGKITAEERHYARKKILGIT